MFCADCGFEIPKDSRTCPGCGGPTPQVCQTCGRCLPADSSFCSACGSRVEARPGHRIGRPGERPGPERLEDTAERRQLTMLFCDLVGSTALSERLDPEDLRDVMRLYTTLCSSVVTSLGGEVAEIAGDGIVAYFGHPRAYENAAERAVQAGLIIVEAVRRLPVTPPLAVRIGVATGLMIVGELIEAGGVRQRELVGSPANLAARLQKLAPPNTVVIGPATHQLIGDSFAVADLGSHCLDGFDSRIPVFAVLAENLALDRFAAHAGNRLPPMAGRAMEQHCVLERWRQAVQGQGQVVLISGEPGIGKSRLIRELRQAITQQPHPFLAFAGSPLHQQTPFFAVVQELRAAACIDRDDAVAERRRKLETYLAGTAGGIDQEALACLAVLCGPPTDANAEAAAFASALGRGRAAALDLLLDHFARQAAVRPLLLVFEDLQWLDATSRELLDRLVDRVAGRSILVVATFRTGFAVAWHDRPQVTTLQLQPLDLEASLAVIAGVARDRTLPGEIQDAIVRRADGIPLFIEELTKSVLESQCRPTSPAAPASFTVPHTLRDTLMARLDRHQEARTVAQIAAAIGREFSHDLLAAVVPLSPPALEAALEDLLTSELIFRQGLPPRSTYVFRHALLQEIAYESQLRRRRRVVHKEIAAALEAGFPETPPEVLGHHFAEAGENVAALACYERAADLARSRSASVEAAAHFARALELLATLPEGNERDRRELELQVGYGGQLIAVRGNAADEVGLAYQRARVLSRAVGEQSHEFRVLRGLQTFHIVRGELSSARPLGEQLLAAADAAGDADLLLQAHRPHGLCLLYMGELRAAKAHLEQAAALYDPERHAQHRFLYGSDPGVLAHCNLAWAVWLLGFAERAWGHLSHALALAKRPEPHPHSNAFALSLAASLAQFQGEAGRAQELAEAVIAIAERHHFAYWQAWGRVVRGWARASAGAASEGLAECEAGIKAYRGTGAGLMIPYFLALQAEAAGQSGRLEEGIAAIDEALALAAAGGIRFYVPELHRLRAVLCEAIGRPTEAVLASLRQGLAEAERQGSRALELGLLAELCPRLPAGDEQAAAGTRLRQLLDDPSGAAGRQPVGQASAALEAAAR